MRSFARIRPDTASIAARYEVQLKLLTIAEKINAQGIRFDIAGGEAMLASAAERQAGAKDAFLALTGLSTDDLGEAQEGKTKLVRDYFWQTLKAPQLVFAKRSNTPQFNTALLVEYLKHLEPDKGGSAALELLVMRAAKKQQQFLQTYLAFAYSGGGKIYGRFNSLGTIGERWSSSARAVFYGKKYSINFQNIPGKNIEIRKRILAQSLRHLFLPPVGHSWLKFDYDSQEARLLAFISQAAQLQEWIASGKKLHTMNAIALFLELKLPDYDTFMAAKDSTELFARAYDAAKNVMYAFAYQFAKGDGTDRYLDVFKNIVKTFPDWDERYVNDLAPRYFALHSEIRELQLKVLAEVVRDGSVTHPIFGGKVYVEPPKLNHAGVVIGNSRGLNQGINYLMQSGGGHIFNRALIAVYPQLNWESNGIMALVHDEIAAWAPIGEENYTAKLITQAMALSFTIYGKEYSIPADVSIGPNWAQLKKVKIK